MFIVLSNTKDIYVSSVLMNKSTHAMQLLAVLRLRLCWKIWWTCCGISIEPKINILNLKSWLRRINQSRLTLRSQISTHVAVDDSGCSRNTLSVVCAWHVGLAVNQKRISWWCIPDHLILLNLEWALNHIRFIIIKWRSHIDHCRFIFVIPIRW